MTRKRHHVSRSTRVVTRFVRIPGDVGPGQARCPGCDAVVRLTPNGHLRPHSTPAGESCAQRLSGLERAPELDALPAVELPPEPARPLAQRRPEGEPSRLDVGSSCRVCGKWLPGERSLCGRCYATRP